MIAGDAKSLRIGCVKYLNARPLIHGREGAVVFDHPATLCRMLAAAELDVAFVSSFEFLRNPIYRIVDDVCVAADGAVYSVFLAHRGRLDAVEEISLDPASATSVNLLRCLLGERGVTPRLVTRSSSEHVPVTTGCAQLLIGDQAIRFRQQHESEYKFWDLGTAWKEATGLPFVFALWLVRPERENASSIADALRALRDRNLGRLRQIGDEQSEFEPQFCSYYFEQCLRFRFAEAEKAGLLKFRSLCEKHGILPRNHEPLRLV